MTTLDQRIDALLGTEETGCEESIFLEFNLPTAGAVVDALRWALYGGKAPPDGRKALLLVLDGIQVGLAAEPCTCTKKLQGYPSIDPEASGSTMALHEEAV